MKYSEVAENVKQLLEKLPPHDEFIYELLLAYGSPKASITRLKSGTYNQAKIPGEVLWKKKVYFKPVYGDIFAGMESLKAEKAIKTYDPRFLVVTDFEQILAVDRKTGDTLDVELTALPLNFDFFLPWAGMEKTKLSNENPADIKAAEKMAKLFDVIKQENLEYVRGNPHWMNIFLSRLLFCLFAEDTGIFPDNSVCNSIASHTAVDASDLTEFFTTLFELLDTPSNLRENLPKHLRCFPYVNGGLFKDHYPLPQFGARARRMIIECGKLNWSEINPDIFGSMFQAVIDPEERHKLGQHYTSVTNIMKVIEPLFLNDFKEELEKANGLTQKNMRVKALHKLIDRIANVKIFDPACGSGNFLIIAYKELRKLEMEVFAALGAFPVSEITVDQFYGIEINDFACETAILAMWLAEHQMNLEYEKRFGRSLTSLPLKDGANIVQGNATRLDWELVCPKNEDDEIYVLGNPPYLGSSMQNKEQKEDMAYVFLGFKNYKNLDYISCWFLKGADYIQDINAQYAFVSTNSICQGEQVALIWPHIFGKGLEIGFAHQSFKWTNNAKGNAGVTCAIIGLRNEVNKSATIYKNGIAQNVKVINAYLTAGSNVIVRKQSKPLSAIPKMDWGSKATDGGNLILSEAEKDNLLFNHSEAEGFIKSYVGSIEFLRGHKRWCLWIPDDGIDSARNVSEIERRLNSVFEFRSKSRAASTRDYAVHSNRFRQMAHKDSPSIIIPGVSSERREYVPMGFLDSNTVINNLAFAIYDAEAWIFAILSSRIHMVWMRTTCGRLESRIRYSSALCYNTFPIPNLTKSQKQTITMHVGNVLEEREKHPEKTIAQLYDPDKMPDGLREEHHQLDLAVDRLYRSKPFSSDEERLEYLFKLYEEMIEKEKLI